MFEPRRVREGQPVLVSECGITVELHLGRYHALPSAAERRFLDHLSGPIVDIGCGPGRAAAHLRGRGVAALGLDVNADLVDLARSNGALCIHQNLWDPIPFEGSWYQVLLLDGNVGIGGDIAKLLERLRRLVRLGGRALIEVDPIAADPGRQTRQMIVREHVNGDVGEPFPWATTTLLGLEAVVAMSGWRCHYVHGIDDRQIVELERIT